MPTFTEKKADRAYESFMKQVPGFSRDPPECKIIQKDINSKKEGAQTNDKSK